MDFKDKITISSILEATFSSNDTFLSHLTDGIPYGVYTEKDVLGLISPTSSPQTLNAYSDFSNFIHQIPKSNSFQFNNRLLAEEYSLLLNTVDLAKNKKGSQVKDSFEEGKLKENYEIYKKYRKNYFDKLTDYNKSYIQNKLDDTWKKDTMPNLLLELDNLKIEWVNDGFKEKVEEVLYSNSVIESNLSILSLWYRWAGKFCEFLSMNSDLKGANSEYATFNMPFRNLLNDSNWQKVEYNHETIKSILPSIPFKDKQQAMSEYSDEIERFSFEYQKLYIDRTWFEPQIFEARFWKRSEIFSNELISDGKLLGTIPSYIQEVIFIKNFYKEIRKGLISEGLEWLGGWAYDKIHKDEPQDDNYYLVAMICKIVPVSHNPDSTLEW